VKPGIGRPTQLSEADVIALAIAACESLLDDQTFGPLARLIDVRRDVPPEVREGQDADYKSAVFTVTSCLSHSVDQPLARDIEVLLHQGMDEYPGHRPSPELLANEMRRTAMRLSIALPESLRTPSPAAAPAVVPEPPPEPAEEPKPEQAWPEQPPFPEPLAEEPVVEEPVVEEPLVEEPLAQEPLIEEPLVEPVPAAQPRAARPSEPTSTTAAARSPRSPRRILLITLGVVVLVAVIGLAANHLLNGSGAKPHPITARTAKGGALSVKKIAVQAGPDGQTQVKIAPAIESKLPSAMTLPGGPGAQLMLLTDPLPGEWKPSVTPRGDLVQLPLDASTFGSARSGAVTGVPANPVARPSTFTDANGNKHQTLVSTMKDQKLPAGATLPNSGDKDVLVYDVPNGTSVLAFALVGDDGYVIASTLRSSMPAQSDPSSF
jgi:outer membrane biosynthesis protein TonB